MKKEIVNKDIEKKEGETEEKQKKRAGFTKTTSVSVSKDFIAMLDKYNLSPTEIFRKGLAVQLAEMGVSPYDNMMNKERIKKIEDFFRLERVTEILDNFIRFSKEVEELRLELKGSSNKLNNSK